MNIRWCLIAGVLVFAQQGYARADRLDLELYKKTPSLVESLRKAGYQTVGVLRFRVQQEGGKESFAAPLCGSLAERVENLLIIHGGPEEKKALGVLHDAGAVANREKVGDWYTDAAQREKLFQLRYPLAWGDRKVKADAFLSGKILLSKDRKQTRLILEVLDGKSLRRSELARMDLETDRGILRDLGMSLGLLAEDRAALARKKLVSRGDEDRLAMIMELEAAAVSVPEKAMPTPEDIGGIGLQVLVNGKAVSCQKKNGKWQLVSPPANAEVHFRLLNRADRKLAVALRLNGVNTLDEQTKEPESCRKWVTYPGRNYRVKGLYVTEKVPNKDETKTVTYPFRILVGEEARTMREELGETRGRIDIDVYEEGNARGELEMDINPRGLPPSREKEARASYLALRSALLKNANLKTQVVVKDNQPKTGTTQNTTPGTLTSREIIVVDRASLSSSEKVKREDFPFPRLVKRMTIEVVPAE